MKQPRILILVSFENTAGAQLASLRIARGLSDRGYDPKVVFLYQQATIEKPDYPFEVLLRRSRPGAFGYIRIVHNLARLLRRERPDCVLTFLPLANVLGQIVALSAGVKRRVVSHRFPINAASPIMRSLDFLWAWLGVYTRVIAVSESVRATCRGYPAWLRSRIVVVHNGLLDWRSSALTRDEARRQFEIPDGTFALVAVGRLSREKNYPLMFSCIQKLSDVTLLVAGIGSQSRELNDMIAKFGIGDRVRFLGKLPHSQIPDLFAAADAFIQTSIYEGHSNSTLEALHAGVPILSPDIPAQREMLLDADGKAAGVLLPLTDVDAWVAAIERLRTDPGVAEEARQAAHKRSKLFRYDTMIAGFDRVLGGA